MPPKTKLAKHKNPFFYLADQLPEVRSYLNGITESKWIESTLKSFVILCPFPQVLVSHWWASLLPAQCVSAAWCWGTPLCQWNSGRLSLRCGPPLMTLRSAVSLQMQRTNPSGAQWPSAPTLCWATPPNAHGRLRGSWSGWKVRSGGSLYWMKCTQSQVGCVCECNLTKCQARHHMFHANIFGCFDFVILTSH